LSEVGSARADQVETLSALPSDPFLQGDIVRLVNGAGDPLDPPFGIVINADCDLAHCKIDGVVSYLPLFPFNTYFKKFWIPSYIEERRTELLQTLGQLCGWDDKDAEQLAIWVREESVDDISTRIANALGIRVSQIKPKIAEFARIAQSEEFDAELLRAVAADQKIDPQQALAKFARKALRTLGDGSFFINEVAGLPTVGFVARLRRVYSLPIEVVFSSEAQFRSSANGAASYAVRFAKLSNLYRFKIAQLFAYQYSRIGLPDEITELNEVAVQAAVIELGG
jgi:hypothetical protein